MRSDRSARLVGDSGVSLGVWSMRIFNDKNIDKDEDEKNQSKCRCHDNLYPFFFSNNTNTTSLPPSQSL